MKKDQITQYRALKNIQRYNTGIYAFLDGVEVYLQPDEHPELFASDKQLKSQDALLTSPLVISKTIQAQKGLRRNTNFSGVYKENELQNYFQELKNSLDNTSTKKPFGLLLLGATHAISIGYDPENNRWMLVNGKELPTKYYSDELQLAKSVIKALSRGQPSNQVTGQTTRY